VLACDRWLWILRYVASFFAACVVIGCHSKPGQEVGGKVVELQFKSTAPIRVMYGKYWPIGNQTDVDGLGQFRVPTYAKSVVAYLDANENGAFDRHGEPSGLCQMTAENSWSCNLARQTVTLHRAITRSEGEQRDSTYVFWDNFDEVGSPVFESELCSDGQCTSLQAQPFIGDQSGKARMFSICGEEGFDRKIGVVPGERSLVLVQPGPLSAVVETELRADELLVHIVGAELQHVLIWGGQRDIGGEITNLLWNSETSANTVTQTKGGYDAHINLADASKCKIDSSCVIVLQLMNVWTPNGDSVRMTEFRTSIDFRELL